MDADYLPFCANPTRPKFRPPPGAVDAHCHVFGPADAFPYAPERKYTPCDAPKEKLFALRDFLGFTRNVIVQGSCHGRNNAAMVDALKTAGDLARGVAVVGGEVTDAELAAMNEAGVRGVRFNFLRRLVDSAPRDVFKRIADRIAPLGWHVVVYFEAPDMDDLTPFLKSLPTTVVIDHMGRPDVSKPVGGSDFQRFVRLLEDNPNFWTKVSGEERLTLKGPPYDDVIPFSSHLVERFPDRVLWGTDWPHPNMKSHMPDDGVLVDSLAKIAPTAGLQKSLLVANPMRLYWNA